MSLDFIKSLIKIVPKWIQFVVYQQNQCILYVDPTFCIPLLFFLRDHFNTQYKVCVDITAVDYPHRPLRFTVVYNLCSIQYNARIRIHTSVDEIHPLASCTPVYSGAGWAEREVWDMFGIFFSGHQDLRRILTDYGFHGHPLRKDFPLTGYREVRYDDSEKRVVTESVECTQEFRYFDFSSPWQQIDKDI